MKMTRRDASPGKSPTTVKLRIMVADRTIAATLIDSETSRDFVSLLPLTLTLRDYASTEKISDLPRRLSTKGTPAGVDPDIGDIAYYAPWGNLAIYYEDFGYSEGLIRLGTIDSGVEAANGQMTKCLGGPRAPGSRTIT